jgi:hypothetical protein
MSWLFSQALVEEYSGDTFLDGEQSAPLSGSNTQQAYCAPDKMTAFSRLSRFGMMYKPLTESLGEALLMSYLAGFHAKTSVLLEKAQELTENDQECGEKWRASFTKYSPATHSWKTHQCSLLGDLDEFSETWPQWGLMRDGQCWEQRMLEQTIRGTESGFVPNGEDKFHTPNTTGLDGGSNSRKALKKRMQMWPTPIASKGGAWRGDGQVSMVARNVETYEEYLLLTQGTSKKKREKYWPTPQASDNRDRGNMSNPSIQRRVAIGKQIMLSQSVDPTSGQLNPMWVEWLMGWPLGWTDLKPLAMDKSHCAQLQHGES